MSAVDEIKARLDIVDVISAYVPLKKAGRNYKANCPFHSEKTPSFFVFPETQTWHCFGACGTGGDVFSFLMKYENLDFGEALQQLAQKAGVTLEPLGQRDQTKLKQLEKLFAIHAAAATYFHDVLRNTAQGEVGRAYAARRGLDAETIQAFQLGFAPDRWRDLSDHLLQRGYRQEDLLEAGLIIVREDGGYYDRFRGRLMVPIRDIRGRVIGFGGRVVGQGEPKYLNSPQTSLFNKSHVLFGIDLAKGAIRAKGYVVLVEGYMDVLQAHQAGIGNVVASMGTALTEQQLTLLKRMTKKYILALDPDTAGDQGTLRGLAVARQTLDRAVPIINSRGWIRYESRLDADIRIMTLPEGQDPDDLIRETPEKWEQLVEAAIPVVDYYFQVTTADLDLKTAKGKSEAVRRLVPVLSEISDQVQREHYVQKLARMVRMDETTIRRQLSVQSQLQAKRPSEIKQPPQKTDPDAVSLEEFCFAALLRRPELLERTRALLAGVSLPSLGENDFEHAENRALFLAWQHIPEETNWQEWVDSLPATLQQRLDFVLENGPTAEELIGEEADRDFARNILRLRRKTIDRTIQNLGVLQTESLEQGDAKAPEYLHTLLHLRADRFSLDRALAENTAQGQRQKREQAAATGMTTTGVEATGFATTGVA